MRSLSMMTAVLFALLACSACRLKMYGLFINYSTTTIIISLTDDEGVQYSRFAIEPGAIKKSVIATGHAETITASGKIAHTTEFLHADPKFVYGKSGERMIYFLVTETGIYPVPRVWRTTWREHVPDIVAGKPGPPAQEKP